MLLSKEDRADDRVTSAWLSYFSSKGITAISGNLTKGKFVDILAKASAPLMAKKREKEANGMDISEENYQKNES